MYSEGASYRRMIRRRDARATSPMQIRPIVRSNSWLRARERVALRFGNEGTDVFATSP